MASGRALIVDFTGEQLPSCLLDASAGSKPRLATLALPLRVVVRGGEGGFRVLAGEETRGPEPGDGALVFHNLPEDLPDLDDEEVQGELVTPFWSSVVRAAGGRGQGALRAETTGYVVYPHGYSADLLAVVRAACARSEGVKRVVFVHEALALVLGLFNSSGPPPARAGRALGVTACAVLARAEHLVEVACFDYVPPAAAAGRVVIRDYFRATCRSLARRLEGCEWLGEVSLLYRVESPALGGPVREKLTQTLAGVGTRATPPPSPPPSALHWLKCLGGAHVAGCSMGAGRQFPPYDVANSLHVGVRLDGRRFYPVLRKEDAARLGALPSPAAESFALSGEPGGGMELSLHAGYSDLVAESVTLGSLDIDAHDASLLSSGRGWELFAAVHLNSPGAGELTLGLMPDDRVIGTLPFVLPGLVC